MHKSISSQFRRILSGRTPLFLAVLGMLASSAFGQTLTTLYSFGAYSTDAVAPGFGVTFDKSGNLYGTTGFGGFQGINGTVFKLTPPASAGGSWTETLVHLFRGTPDGKIPQSRLVLTSQGLVGTTEHGGADDLGTVYLIGTTEAATGRESILHSFGTVPDDAASANQPVFPAAEGFYAVDQGGANNTGVFYLLSRSVGSATYTQDILYSFGKVGSGDAAFPSGDLVRDSKGNFYGLTGQGGTNNLGAVYELSPPASGSGPWTEKVVFSFSSNEANGTLPAGHLVLGPRGVLYGTTNGGGASGAGTIFQLTPPASASGAWRETVLYSFTGGSDGGFPENGVISDGKGNLLGAAGNQVFRLNKPQSAGGSWTESVLHSFSGPDGFFVTGPLTLSNGSVYGTTSAGGDFGVGTAYQLTLQ